MATEIAIDGPAFLINGRPTYADADPRVRGLLLNSRMVQAIFDDECAETREQWRYPDTGVWDADRNTDEFCRQLPVYRSYGLLAVTVGLQGGGSVFSPQVYDNYSNSAFTPGGEFKQPYFDRLGRILKAADENGMVVIVNYFYWKQMRRIPNDATVRDLTARITEHLLTTGHRNVMVDIANESNPFWERPLLEPDNVHALIEIVKATTLDGRGLPVAVSTAGGDQIPTGKWRAMEDFALPHGNGCTPEQLKAKLLRLKDTPEHKDQPRPIVVNEDSIFIENLVAAVEAGCSWGFYCQGYGSEYKDRTDWTQHDRETRYEDLSGFQTVPVNWSINTPDKQAFFEKVKEITGGGE